MSVIPIDSHKHPEVGPKQEGPPSRRAPALPCPAEKSAGRGDTPKPVSNPFQSKFQKVRTLTCLPRYPVSTAGARALLTQARPSESGICHQRQVLGPRSRQGVLVAGCGWSIEKNWLGPTDVGMGLSITSSALLVSRGVD